MPVSAATLSRRAAYIQSAYKGYRPIGTQNMALGTTLRFKLDPIGLITSLFIEVVAVVNITTAAVTLSQQAPYCLLPRIQLQDANGNARINAPASHIWAMSSIWRGKPDFRQAGVMYNSPIIPTQIGNNQTIRFYLNIPVSFSEIDLRGALSTTNNYDQYLAIDIASQLLAQGDNDILYTGGLTSNVAFVSGYINAWQRYYSSNASVQPPSEDLNTVHYIEGQLRITDGLSAGTERIINYPINRNVSIVTMLYQNGGLMRSGDVSRIRQLSGATEILNLTADSMYSIQRDILGGSDLPWSMFFFRHDREVATPYANANQIGFTPAAAGVGNTYLGVGFESFGT